MPRLARNASEPTSALRRVVADRGLRARARQHREFRDDRQATAVLRARLRHDRLRERMRRALLERRRGREHVARANMPSNA